MRGRMEFPTAKSDVPFLDTRQMVEVDRMMMEDYKIELVQMMENAGRNLAHLARVRFFDRNSLEMKVIVMAGPGGNGGGALVAARHLHNWGAKVRIFTTRADEALAPVPAHQLAILRRMQVPVQMGAPAERMLPMDLLIDGLIGYSLQGAPRGCTADLIRWANHQEAPRLSLDVPSGLDAASGQVFDPAIQATATLTLALPKHGLSASSARNLVGELYLADISVPPVLYARESLKINVGPLFAESEILRLW